MQKLKEKVNNKEELIIYANKKGGVKLRTDQNKETIWATLNQIASLFDVQKAAISKHLKNIYSIGELSKKTTVSILETVQTENSRPVKRKMYYYNLDAIIAVGYRVNSKKATQFRIWATKILRNYLMKGVVVNMDHLKRVPDSILHDLNEKIEFIQRTIQTRELNITETNNLLSVIHDYAHSWTYLKEYDDRNIKLHKSKNKEKIHFDYEFVKSAIDNLKGELIVKKEASELFATDKDNSLQGILKVIYQTFDGKELYVSLEEKSAHLLYFIIKDHPFIDGNKRVASFLFIYFLKLNGILLRQNGEKKINDNTLVALALLIAESNPKEKELMIALVTNLLI